MNRILKKIRPNYLMTDECQLYHTLMECYEKAYMDIGAELGCWYRDAVYAGLRIWVLNPEQAGRSSGVDDIILDIFDRQIEGKYTDLVQKRFSRLENETAEIVRREMLQDGWAPEKINSLEKIPLRGFQTYWSMHAKVYIREEVAEMVEEFNFWELLDDLPQLSRESRIKMRVEQLLHLRNPLERQLIEDRIKLTLRFLANFGENSFRAMYCNQLWQSLRKWEKTI